MVKNNDALSKIEGAASPHRSFSLPPTTSSPKGTPSQKLQTLFLCRGNLYSSDEQYFTRLLLEEKSLHWCGFFYTRVSCQGAARVNSPWTARWNPDRRVVFPQLGARARMCVRLLISPGQLSPFFCCCLIFSFLLFFFLAPVRARLRLRWVTFRFNR